MKDTLKSNNKKLKLVSFFIMSLIFATLIFSLSTSVNAQGLCDFFPCGNGGVLPTPGDTTSFGEKAFFWATSAIFSGFIGTGVFIFVKSALKIIRSEGDESKLEEATGAMRSVFIGIGLLVLGVIGLVIVLSIFNAGGILNQGVEKPAGVGDAPLL